MGANVSQVLTNKSRIVEEKQVKFRTKFEF